MRTSLTTGARRPMRTALAAVLSGLVWVSMAVVPAYAANPDTLSHLQVWADGSQLTLSPSFSSGTTSYSVPQIPWVDRDVVDICARSTDYLDPQSDGIPTLEVRVVGDGSGTWWSLTDDLTCEDLVDDLSAGANTVQVRVTTNPNSGVPTQKTYSISIPVGGASTATTFSTFGCVAGCSLSPGFTANTRAYSTSWLDNSVNDIEVFYSLADGAIEFRVVRWADPETPPTDADFEDCLSCDFDDSFTSIFLGAGGDAEGDVAFDEGHVPSVYSFRVVSESGTTADYVLSVYKRSANDEALLEDGTLGLRLTASSVLTLTQVDGGDTGFLGSKKNYTTSVPSGTSSVTVRVNSTYGDEQLIELRNSSATTTWTRVYSSDSIAVAMVGGTNVLEVRVRAGDGPPYTENDNQTTYTVTISGAGPATANLTGLTLSAGTLTPAFASGTLNYTATVAGTQEKINVTATGAGTLTRTVNGGTAIAVTSGSPFEVDLANNAVTTIRVIVTVGASTATYVIAVTRGSANPTLATLSLGAACPTLNPAFTANTPPVSGGYACTVAAGTTSVTAAATPTTAGDKVEYRLGTGDWATTGTFTLASGVNKIDVRVTKQGSGSQPSSTYTLNVTKPGAPGFTAFALSTVNGDKVVPISPAFSPTTYAYTARVLATSVAFAFTKSDAGATVTVVFDSSQLPVPGASGTIPLDAGKNVITFQVTPAGGGTPTNYVIEITAPRCKVVNVVGLSLKEARAKLKQSNCLVKVVRESSSTVASGRVIRQDPVVSLTPKQNKRAPGFRVTLYVSKGP